MSRPMLSTISRSDTDWLDRLNSNFEKLFDAPFPLNLEGSELASKYDSCLSIDSSQRLKVSNGTVWKEIREQLTPIADLNATTSTLSDLITAINNLLGDMKSKGWMAPS